MNIGVQYELKPGLVLTADYVRNRGVHFNQTINRNRHRRCRNSLKRSRSAVCRWRLHSTSSPCNIATTSQNVDCMIAKGRSIRRFCDNGLGAGSGVDGFVFSGRNRTSGGIGIISPIGLSLYRHCRSGWAATLDIGGLSNVTTNITYALGRFESTAQIRTFCRDQPSVNDRPRNSSVRHEDTGCTSLA